MLTALRKRHENEDEGFTLIELMVVVLIIAILLAIAIPTFLGARERAQNRAAQSNLRNALTAEKVYYTDAQAYTLAADTSTNPIKGIEPSLTFAGNSAPSVTGTVYSQVTDNQTANPDAIVILGAKSAAGTCFYIRDVAVAAASPGVGAGTSYAQSTASPCPAPGSVTSWTTKWN